MTETIGIDLGGTKALVGVLDERREVLWQSRTPSAGLGEDELVEMLKREVRSALGARPSAKAIGIGAPCTIDYERGIAIAAVNLPLKDVPIRDLLADAAGVPAFLDNDANVAALAEHLYGAGRDARNLVVLTIGTGIGGGLIIEGEVYRGTIGAGAELGHTVIQMDGPPCQGNCPGRGCLESLASGTALGREGRAAAERAPDSALGRLLAAGEEIDGRAVTDAARAGDEAAVDVLGLIGRRLGVGCTSFANIFEPDAIVVGGGVIAAGDLLLEPARRELRERALEPMNGTPILAAELGPEAGLVGAAALARHGLGGG